MIEILDTYYEFVTNNFNNFLFLNTYLFLAIGYGIHGVFYNIFEALKLFFIGFAFLFIYDLFLYLLGILLGGIKYLDSLIYNNKKLFYIYFRFIPLLGNFGVFFGSFLSNKINFKQDFKMIFFGNLVFLIFSFIFWEIIKIFYKIEII